MKNMVKKVKSAGGVVYYIDKETNEPKFLLVKRHALSKKIEWVAPKWKIQNGELPEQAAVREIGEEVGLQEKNLQVKQKLDTLSLQLYNDDGKLWVDKDITYFLIHHTWEPEDVHVASVEWYIGMYVWVDIERVLWLIEYRNLRELVRMAYGQIWKISKKDNLISKLF